MVAADAGLLLERVGNSNSQKLAELQDELENESVVLIDDISSIRKSLCRHLDVMGTPEKWSCTNSVWLTNGILKELMRNVIRDSEDGGLNKRIKAAVEVAFERGFDKEKVKRKAREAAK